MMQFDVRAADRLWEGVAPAHGAPEWYHDVSGLIETAHGPAEPHELVDEPIVVDDMHRTTRGRPPCHRHHKPTIGRVIAMKAVATTASVLGVAAAAAATTGIAATLASVVGPVIEEHVLTAEDDEGESATPAAAPPGAPANAIDAGLDDHLMALAGAPPATPMPAPDTRPADPKPVATEPPPATEPPAVDRPRAEPPRSAGPKPRVESPVDGDPPALAARASRPR